MTSILLSLILISPPALSEDSCEREIVKKKLLREQDTEALKNLGTMPEEKLQSIFNQILTNNGFSNFYALSLSRKTCHKIRFRNYLKTQNWKQEICKSNDSQNKQLTCLEKLIKREPINSTTDLVLLIAIAVAEFKKFEDEKNTKIVNLRLNNLLLELIDRVNTEDHIFSQYRGGGWVWVHLERWFFQWQEEKLYRQAKVKLLRIINDKMVKIKADFQERVPAQDQAQKIQKAISMLEEKIEKIRNKPSLRF